MKEMDVLHPLCPCLKRKGIAEKGSEKYFGEKKKEKTGNVQLGYIDDIHVMGIFIAC